MPTLVLDDPDVIAAATHPVRAAILDAMRRPATAAQVGRAIGQSRQNVNYHVRELERAGLVRRVGQRRKGNFIEQVYVVVADTLVLSPRSTWGDATSRASAMADQLSLAELVTTGERLQRDGAVLLDRAAFDGDEVPSASATIETRFADEAARAAFLHDYVELVTELAARYGSRGGDRYRVILAAYPDPEDA